MDETQKPEEAEASLPDRVDSEPVAVEDSKNLPREDADPVSEADPDEVNPDEIIPDESGSVGAFLELDASVILEWRLQHAIEKGGIGLGLTAGGVGLGLGADISWILIAPVWLVLLGILGGLVVWYPNAAYEKWRYRADATVLELKFGVIWERSVLIPMSRLQHVDLHRGPLERHFGLTSLEIHTAGTRHASHRIPGIPMEKAVQLRDELVGAANLGV